MKARVLAGSSIVDLFLYRVTTSSCLWSYRVQVLKQHLVTWSFPLRHRDTWQQESPLKKSVKISHTHFGLHLSKMNFIYQLKHDFFQIHNPYCSSKLWQMIPVICKFTTSKNNLPKVVDYLLACKSNLNGQGLKSSLCIKIVTGTEIPRVSQVSMGKLQQGENNFYCFETHFHIFLHHVTLWCNQIWVCQPCVHFCLLPSSSPLSLQLLSYFKIMWVIVLHINN